MNGNLRDKLCALTNRCRAEMLAFCQRLVQTPSLSGEEGNVAALIRTEMERLGYDEVWCDDWGNVVGLLRGQGTGRSVMFNGHMDHILQERANRVNGRQTTHSSARCEE